MEVVILNESSDEFKKIKKQWYDRAHKATIETLPALLMELTEKYRHDYGTICHAVSVAAIASAWAVCHSPQGGITGFQAGCIMWDFIREWNYSSNETGLCIIDYDNFIYPQYADQYDKTMSLDTWNAIQEKAKKELSKADAQYTKYLSDLEKYKQDIAAFISKYPDYYERKDYYDPLGMGTGAEWEAEAKKKASGFEFAPQEPYCPVTKTSNVYQHWISIVNGIVPFGYKAEGE
jgi:hypothetical protein